MVEKERQFLKVTVPSGRIYYLSFEDFNLRNASDHIMRSVPAGFSYEMRNSDNSLARLICAYVNEHRVTFATMAFLPDSRKNILRIAEKLYSIDKDVPYCYCGHEKINDCDYDFACKNLNAVLEELRNSRNISIPNAVYAVKTKKRFSFIPPANECFNEQMRKNFFEWIKCEGTSDDCFVNKNNIERIVYFLSSGKLYSFFDNNIDKAMDYLRNMYWYANTLGITSIPKGDFMRLYCQYKETYEINKDKYDNKILADWQNLKNNAFSFEDDDFVVVAPQSKEEFRIEGDNQNNCVFRLYYKKVLEKKCRIIFVRKKSDASHSYITVEIYNDGKIGMYLAKNNSQPCEQSAMAFKEKLQEHIIEHWND